MTKGRSPLSSQSFSTLMEGLGIDFSGVTDIAVAVSGGGDSLALSLLLADWVKEHDMTLHGLTVNHGLRAEAADEAKYVAGLMKSLGVTHKTLLWEGEKPKTAIQEAARDARYRLMGEYCRKKKIRHLFVAHHGQDQMETILFRMAKGTGLDGLIGMRPVQEVEGGLVLCRPLLTVSHNELLATCESRKIVPVDDPSNENIRYARVRIRSIIDVLEKEGMSAGRIDALSRRVNSAIELIDYLIEDKYKSIVLYKDTERIEIKYSEYISLPNEGKTRILKQVIADLHPTKKYPARLEDIEALAARMGENFRGATLGKCIFRKKKDVLVVGIEKIKN
jgi:tRNA(Ile)-lysidine synthase